MRVLVLVAAAIILGTVFQPLILALPQPFRFYIGTVSLAIVVIGGITTAGFALYHR